MIILINNYYVVNKKYVTVVSKNIFIKKQIKKKQK